MAEKKANQITDWLFYEPAGAVAYAKNRRKI
jgi:hypothetical protein